MDCLQLPTALLLLLLVTLWLPLTLQYLPAHRPAGTTTAVVFCNVSIFWSSSLVKYFSSRGLGYQPLLAKKKKKKGSLYVIFFNVRHLVGERERTKTRGPAVNCTRPPKPHRTRAQRCRGGCRPFGEGKSGPTDTFSERGVDDDGGVW